MAAPSQYSTFASTYGAKPNWPTLIQGFILAVCNEVGGEPCMFDAVEYLDTDLERRSRLEPNSQLNNQPVLKEGDQVTIGCRVVRHANSALPPISSPGERVIQIVPADTVERPLHMDHCIVPPLQEGSEWMTWHDRGAGTHNPECRQPPALAYHSGTVLTVLSILRCRKYLPQCHGNAIYAGRTYPVVKVIQQLLVSKTN
eukprot:4847280-Amphidinium_carterae.2